jgi:hypothetical protein
VEEYYFAPSPDQHRRGGYKIEGLFDKSEFHTCHWRLFPFLIVLSKLIPNTSFCDSKWGELHLLLSLLLPLEQYNMKIDIFEKLCCRIGKYLENFGRKETCVQLNFGLMGQGLCGV